MIFLFQAEYFETIYSYSMTFTGFCRSEALQSGPEELVLLGFCPPAFQW